MYAQVNCFICIIHKMHGNTELMVSSQKRNALDHAFSERNKEISDQLWAAGPLLYWPLTVTHLDVYHLSKMPQMEKLMSQTYSQPACQTLRSSEPWEAKECGATIFQTVLGWGSSQFLRKPHLLQVHCQRKREIQAKAVNTIFFP